MTLDLIKIRRELHQIPEIGLEEVKTQAYLLERIGEITAGKDFVEQRTWRTGILVFLKGWAPEKTIGWRTDIDALPIVEETGLDFASQHEGRMHACGHDMHMTVALGLLDKMVQVQPKNNLLFLFQPAEENEAGGMYMRMVLLEIGSLMNFMVCMFVLILRSEILRPIQELCLPEHARFLLLSRVRADMRLFRMRLMMPLWLLLTLLHKCRQLSVAMLIQLKAVLLLLDPCTPERPTMSLLKLRPCTGPSAH